MASITITVDGVTGELPDACVPRLQVQVDRTNAATKGAATLLEWLALHLQEIAIADELAAAIDGLRQQGEADANVALAAAVKAARDELIATLAAPAVAGSGPE